MLITYVITINHETKDLRDSIHDVSYMVSVVSPGWLIIMLENDPIFKDLRYGSFLKSIIVYDDVVSGVPRWRLTYLKSIQDSRTVFTLPTRY